MTEVEDTPKGYWWQCVGSPTHRVSSEAATGYRLVEFFFELARSGWDQGRLSRPCRTCGAVMRLTYDFPRQVDAHRLAVIRIVGLTTWPGYLPMMWEAHAEGEDEPWFDFKYVSRDEDGRHRSYGLNRPAVFSRNDLAALFALYESVAGHPVLPTNGDKR